MTGIPCKHGVAAIFVNCEKSEDYTHPCYYKDAYVETYKTPIPPMPGQSEWMSSKPVAHIIYKPPGRPPIKRKRDTDEPNPYKVFKANRPVRCARCQQEGRNARGCKANVTGETPWERRQRLQKRKSVSFYKFFLFKCKMLITDTVKTCSYLVAGKWKAFYTLTRIPSPIFITNPILSSAPTNTSALHYGLILIQPGSRVTATSSNSIAISSSSTATSSMVRATNFMVTELKSMVFFRI